MQKSIHLQLLFDKILHLMSLMSLSATFKHRLLRISLEQQPSLLLDEYLMRRRREEGLLLRFPTTTEKQLSTTKVLLLLLLRCSTL